MVTKTEILSLTTNPVLISNYQETYIQAINGEFFFIFSEEKPSFSQCQKAHMETKIHVDCTSGKIWAWKKHSSKTKLIISN
ncbi:hypothetical protein I2F27_12975 [Acinetobacter sp. B5B]|uniref:hypothetical protein n=1 Tax=Acinetobacter baretiae TaxID=2605383 RepID=UPI0018C29290|nr:hypothetical protein [Acinetobacter baretiae]MBF7684203.1 hypothetical protein [Acinetobacter baretiae]MBF7686576.1 hypothetical protein [Acinetobacter baretiae]